MIRYAMAAKPHSLITRAAAQYVLSVVETSRCDVPARVVAGGTVSGKPAAKGAMVAPLNAARTAQRTVPTTQQGSV